ncbi:MAG TPA: SUF system NifU family Fe-S cluster assembly protein [Bacteroidota bacterium]|nr:SUF system NifU family Fe-S cluster assembly protein [Bacteroidota bacterium]
MSALRELYQQVILDHNRNPKNFRPMPDATQSVEGYNPLCGDHYTVFVRMDGDVIADVSFTGTGCAISKASASVMSSVLKGRTRDEAEKIFGDFHRLVTEGAPEEEVLERLGKLAAFAGVSEFPARVKCASLPWHTLHAALRGEAPYISAE